MRGLLTERNLVVVLFVMVLIAFSFAQKETKKMEQFYNGRSYTNPPANLKFEAEVTLPAIEKSKKTAVYPVN